MLSNDACIRFEWPLYLVRRFPSSPAGNSKAGASSRSRTSLGQLPSRRPTPARFNTVPAQAAQSFYRRPLRAAFRTCLLEAQ